MRSVYIHIPFCRSICSYCDFCKSLYVSSWADMYLDALKEEIASSYEEDEVSTIYIGGGTPSVLNMSQLKKLFDIIKIFKLVDKYEFTFEMNVNDINNDILMFLRRNGVNRLSIGVESFNKFKLKFLNRKHNSKNIYESIQSVKECGFDNFNVDLIYAVPIENLNILISDLSKFIKLKAPHISTYSLIIEENTVLHINNIKPIDEDLDYKMYKHINRKLKKLEYNHYEVSNFALPGYESKHNLNYWNNGEYYGFGLGAHGFIDSVRYENTRSLNEYLNHNFKLTELILSKREDMENELILGLRKGEGVDIHNFYKKFNKNIQDVFDLNKAVKEGFLVLENNNLKIPESKIYIMNEILNMIIKKIDNNEDID